MQKEQQNKKITFAPAISTSYLFILTLCCIAVSYSTSALVYSCFVLHCCMVKYFCSCLFLLCATLLYCKVLLLFFFLLCAAWLYHTVLLLLFILAYIQKVHKNKKKSNNMLYKNFKKFLLRLWSIDRKSKTYRAFVNK